MSEARSYTLASAAPVREPLKLRHSTTTMNQSQPDPALNDREFLTPREVASRIGLSYHSVLRAIRRGDLEAFEVVRRLRIEISEYERWARASPVPADTARVRRADGNRSNRSSRQQPGRRPRRGSPASASFAAELRAIE